MSTKPDRLILALTADAKKAKTPGAAQKIKDKIRAIEVRRRLSDFLSQ